MNAFALFFAVFTLCLLQADARTFTDAQGRKLEAEVGAVQQGQVCIRRADGKEFTLPVTTRKPHSLIHLPS